MGIDRGVLCRTVSDVCLMSKVALRTRLKLHDVVVGLTFSILTKLLGCTQVKLGCYEGGARADLCGVNCGRFGRVAVLICYPDCTEDVGQALRVLASKGWVTMVVGRILEYPRNANLVVDIVGLLAQAARESIEWICREGYYHKYSDWIEVSGLCKLLEERKRQEQELEKLLEELILRGEDRL